MIHKHRRIKLFALLLLCTVLGIVYIVKSHLSYSGADTSDQAGLLRHVSRMINSGQGKLATTGQACRVPVLEVNASEIMKLIKPSEPVVCEQNKDWVEVEGSTAKIAEWAKRKYGKIQCSFTDIIRESDFKQHQGLTTTTHTEYNMEVSDVVQVHCTTEDGKVWTKVMTGIRSDQDIFDRTSWFKVPKDSLKLNVLMFGFDSVSHAMWKRKLPKTYKYVTNDLKGVALNGYNIIGDGTPQALIPILTGRTELELPDTRKRMGKKAQFVNVYPFIWNDFQNNGYATAWSEDLAEIGTFTYRLKGFQEQPVDHYMRTFYMAAASSLKKEKKYCYGGISRYQIMLDFLRNMYNVYKDRPKFIFGFHSEYSHNDLNEVGKADEGLLEFLESFNAKGYLNDTLLILMSDHGSRFTEVRNTQQGKQEERLPGFMFVFPPWFRKKYPEEIANFRTNANRLSTPFDVHETLKNVLHFEGGGKGTVLQRGISLFKEIPLSRSCRDASIEPHWCTCLNWEEIPVMHVTVEKAVKYFVNFINSYTSEHRDLCAELKLGETLWSAKLLPNENLLKFRKNADYDGFVGDMTDNTKVTVETYQVKVSLIPGNMLFEASIRYYTKKDKFLVTTADISRINKYSHMTHCIEDNDILHQLRKYCYCS